MGMIFEDLEDHEGYAARGRPSGTLTSTWIRDTVAFDAYVGACTCGWAGTGQHSPTEAGRTAAEDQWEHAHAGPLLAAAVPSRVSELVDNLREEMAELADDRPRAARTVAQRVTAWSENVLQLTSHHRATSATRRPGSPGTGRRTVGLEGLGAHDADR